VTVQLTIYELCLANPQSNCILGHRDATLLWLITSSEGDPTIGHAYKCSPAIV